MYQLRVYIVYLKLNIAEKITCPAVRNKLQGVYSIKRPDWRSCLRIKIDKYGF